MQHIIAQGNKIVIVIPVFLLRPPPARVASLTFTLLEFLSARQSVAPVPPVSSLASLPSCGDRGLQRSEANINIEIFCDF